MPIDGYNPVKQKRSRTRLFELGVPVGAQLLHIDNEMETATVISVNPDRIRHEGQDGSLSALASKVHKKYYPNANDSIQGAAYWQYQGKTLWDLRIEMERTLEADDS